MGLHVVWLATNRKAVSGALLSDQLANVLDPRTCIIGLNELQAQSVLIELVSAGCRVPQDVQLACLNLTPNASDTSSRTPSQLGITGIRADASGLGAAGASLLLTFLKYGNFTYQTLTVDCDVVIANTTGRVTIKADKPKARNLAG